MTQYNKMQVNIILNQTNIKIESKPFDAKEQMSIMIKSIEIELSRNSLKAFS